MNQEQFQQFFDETVKELHKLLVLKGGEYAGSEDRLGNFKRGAERINSTPLQVLWIYASKHIDSIETFIRDEACGRARPRSESIAGRFDDLINYCILAKAILGESEATGKVIGAQCIPLQEELVKAQWATAKRNNQGSNKYNNLSPMCDMRYEYDPKN